MERIINSLKTHTGRSQALFILLLGSLYLPWAVNSFFIVIFVLHSFFNPAFAGNFKKEITLLSFTVIFYFLICAISLFYTTHLDEGLAKLQTRLSFLIMPIALVGSGIIKSENFKMKVLNAFVIFTLLAVLAALLNALITSIEMGSLYKIANDNGTIVKQSYFTYTHLAFFIMHPAYFSLYTGSAIFISLYLLLKQQFLFKQKYLQWMIIIFLSIFLFLLQGRMSIIAFVLIGVLSLIIYFFKRKDYLKGIGFLAIPLIFLAAIIFLTPDSINRRFTELTSLNYNLQAPSVYNFNGITIRLAEWECALDAIREKPIFGYGLGDAQKALEEQYVANNFVVGIRDKYNSHNQYFDTWLQSGIIGLIILLAIFASAIVVSIRRSNYLLLVLSAFVMTAMMTESIFDRQWAIGFFCSLYLYLFFNAACKNQQHSIKSGN